MKVLVFGASGMIGHRLWSSLSLLGHEVYGTLRRPNLGILTDLPGIDSRKCFYNVNVLDENGVETVIREVRPDIVINATGVVKQLAQKNTDLNFIRMNSEVPHLISQFSETYAFRMIQMSTDCVFDGNKGNYSESDIPLADDIYGKSKILGEIASRKEVTTIRTSTIGREIFPHGGLLEWFLSQQGKKVKGFSRAIYSGFPTHTLARIFSDYLFKHPEINGVIHIGSQPVDKFHLLEMIRNKFKLDIEIEKDSDFRVDRSLDSTAFSKMTGYQALSWESMLKDLEVDWDFYQNLRSGQ